MDNMEIIKSKTFKIKSDQLDINSEIILENELGECFNFKVVNIYNNSEYKGNFQENI